MKIIVFEGLDKSGKNTQSELFYKYLLDKGYKVAKSEFHRYDTPTGELIRKWLYGQYEVSQETIELIMAADKQAQQEWFKQLEKEKYDYLILDRYTASQLVYGSYNSFKNKKNDFQHLKYENYLLTLTQNLKPADYTFFISITPEESMVRKGQHGENDRYESDLELLTYASDKYKEILFFDIFSSFNNFTIDGFQPIEEVHTSIIDIFENTIKLES